MCMSVSTWEEAAGDIAARLNVELIDKLASYDWYDPLAEVSRQMKLVRDGAVRTHWQPIAEIALVGYVRCTDQPVARALNELLLVLADKQRDYGHKNITCWGDRSLLAIAVRASDKVARLENLAARSVSPRNESVADSWLDLAGYAILGLMVTNNTFTLPLREHKDN